MMRLSFFLLSSLAIGSALAQESPSPDRAVLCYMWLAHQQSATGILGNQEADDFAGLYSNALASIAYVHQGDFKRAEDIFAFYQKRFPRYFSRGKVAGFPQFANVAAGAPDDTSDQWIGDNA